MTDNIDDNDPVDDKEIIIDDKPGYKKPPKNSQFKKGKSGNPKGRPKGSLNFMTLFRQEFNRQIPITENGKRVMVTKKHAFAMKLIADAFKDGQNTYRYIMPLLKDDAEREEELERQKSSKSIKEADKAILKQFLGIEDNE